MTAFVIKSGDRLPAINAVLSRSDGTPVDLTGATVDFVMRDPTALAPKVSHEAGIVSPATAGQVVYFWQPTDTDTPGLYDASWVVVFGDGTRQTFPTDDYLQVEVQIDMSKTGAALTPVRPSDGVRPSVAAVGALLPNRGRDRTGVQFGTDSIPSYAQVQDTIEMMASEVDAELDGVVVTPRLAGLARYAITLAAAATVEVQFFPEQASSAGDTSGVLWSRYQQVMTRFRTLLAEEGGGPAMFASAPALSPTLAGSAAYSQALAAAGLPALGWGYE